MYQNEHKVLHLTTLANK